MDEKTGKQTGSIRNVNLADKFDINVKNVYVSGTQAVVRMLMMQATLDKKAGLNTAGFVCGYRGSPIAGLDQQVVRAKKFLAPHNIVFQAGQNEDLAATACWGSQQAEIRGEGKYDGVFAVWYGKGPGVDRTGDVFRHANMAGSSKHGGVLALMGDDHTCESSTVAHQSEFAFIDAMMPVLNPANVEEMIEYGLYGYALSRFSGTWVALKCVKDNIEQTASVESDIDKIKINIPSDFNMPKDGLNIRFNDSPLPQEERLFGPKIEAVKAFVRANNLNKIICNGGKKPWLGIATVGKNYMDVRQAFDELGIDEVSAANMGIRLYKVGCPWPLEPQGVEAFAKGLERILVVEEKRSLIEAQIKDQLYGSKNAPMIEGKHNLGGDTLFTAAGGLDANDIAIVIGLRILEKFPDNKDIEARVNALKEAQELYYKTKDVGERIPTYCSGCPHNTSTKVPEGMRAGAGIGCHFMVQWMERRSEGVTQMGGEGAQWVGEAPFSKRQHIFQNLGDGTYAHSGSTAIRFALASKLNITYKILYNDAVAMTGGQPIEGGLTPPMIANQLAAEGVERIAFVSNEPWKYDGTEKWPAGMTFHDRDEFDAVQLELAAVPGVSVIIFDQTCAAEKRRRRKRGQFPDPAKRIFINERVCEGCGDCGVQSNCVSIQPVETEFGRKRQIDQTSCNKDYTCVKGFCPSFVTIEGGKLRAGAKGDLKTLVRAEFPEPTKPDLQKPWAIIITGVGGTGITTLAAVLGMAAHLEEKGVGIIDMAGLAQKGGAVFSHMRIGKTPQDVKSIRVSARKADLILGGDLVVAGTKKVLAGIKPGETISVVNTAEIYPGDFARHADYTLPTRRLQDALKKAKGKETRFADVNAIANRLFGNTVAANMMITGLAYQLGGLPLSAEAIEKAIELNGEAPPMNIAAFRAGRELAINPKAFDLPEETSNLREDRTLAQTLDEKIERRVKFLNEYQNAAYAERYSTQVNVIRQLEEQKTNGQNALTEAVAKYLFKLMAYKDEYEVARLYTDGAFLKDLNKRFEGDFKISFNLAPPLLSKNDPATGHPKKMVFGPWMLSAFGLLAKFKGLRGTAFDIFGYTEERRTERKLIADYEAMLKDIIAHLTPDNHATAVALASLPEKIRGYGHVKERHLKSALGEWQRLREELTAAKSSTPYKAAAE